MIIQRLEDEAAFRQLQRSQRSIRAEVALARLFGAAAIAGAALLGWSLWRLFV